MEEFKIRLATVYGSRATGVPAPILTEMLYDMIHKVNPIVKRGDIRKIVDSELPMLSATKKLYSLLLKNEVK